MTVTTSITRQGGTGASADGAAGAVLDAIRTRRSHPQVLPEAPARAVIDALLAAANCAPNHHLTQPWRFFVLRGDARRRLGEAVLERIAKRWPLDDPDQEAARRRNVPAS
ncbi:MAG: nitroreductase family protein, partial [Chloroflexota bacterium]